MSNRRDFIPALLGLSAALLFLSGLSFLTGDGRLQDVDLTSVFLELRALRLASACIIGASLAVAGVMMQGLFRNPLALIIS